jgi:diguanylate cyclase (GGDEF)-like protein
MPLAAGTAFALLCLAAAWGARRHEHAVAREVAAGLATLAPIGLLVGLAAPAVLPALLVPLVALRRAGRRAVTNEHQALHDVLTGLPNRALFSDRVERALAAARRDGAPPVVMLLDLDRFKEINDSLGHHHGDELLRQVGPRISGVLRSSDTVARLGGDEFAVLLTGVHAAQARDEVGAKLLAALGRSFCVGGIELEVGGSLGIAVFPGDGENVQALLRSADAAMYEAKRRRSGRHHAGRDHARDPLALVADLRGAIEGGELGVVYQPVVDLRSGRLHAAEALVRWRHPERGLVLPGSFVAHAEHTSLMRPLTLHVIDAALAQSVRWRRAGLDLRVAVNLSSRVLLDTDLASDLERMLAAWRVPPRALALEVTEAAIMADPDLAAARLAELCGLGVGLAIDDFGTGWSSLGALHRLPVDEIKIDRSFVAGLARDGAETGVVRSALDVARNLGLRVVAEGIEDEAVRGRLAELGCRFGQGYVFSAPLEGDMLAGWDSARRSGALSPAA